MGQGEEQIEKYRGGVEVEVPGAGAQGGGPPEDPGETTPERRPRGGSPWGSRWDLGQTSAPRCTRRRASGNRDFTFKIERIWRGSDTVRHLHVRGRGRGPGALGEVPLGQGGGAAKDSGTDESHIFFAASTPYLERFAPTLHRDLFGSFNPLLGTPMCKEKIP